MFRLFDKHKQYEQSQQDVARLQEHVDHLLQTQDELHQVIKDKDEEINRLVVGPIVRSLTQTAYFKLCTKTKNDSCASRRRKQRLTGPVEDRRHGTCTDLALPFSVPLPALGTVIWKRLVSVVCCVTCCLRRKSGIACAKLIPCLTFTIYTVFFSKLGYVPDSSMNVFMKKSSSLNFP